MWFFFAQVLTLWVGYVAFSPHLGVLLGVLGEKGKTEQLTNSVQVAKLM